MKRRELIRHLEAHGCRLKREGAEHTLYWNPSTGESQTVLRYAEIIYITARKSVAASVCHSRKGSDNPGVNAAFLWSRHWPGTSRSSIKSSRTCSS
jgi:hypothetical protein